MINFFLLTETDRGDEALFSALSHEFDSWLAKEVTSLPIEPKKAGQMTQDRRLNQLLVDDKKAADERKEDDQHIQDLKDCVKVIQRVLDDAHM